MIAGLYEVRAEKECFVSPDDPTTAFVESANLIVPPAVLDLDLHLSCAGAPNQPPVADAGCPYIGDEGSPIALDGSASFDPVPEGSIVLYEWDLDNDGVYDATGATTTVIFLDDGPYTIGLCVIDDQGGMGIGTAEIAVHNLNPSARADQASQNVQYSDAIAPVTLTTSDVAADGLSTSSTSLPDGLVLSDPAWNANGGTSACTWTLAGNANIQTEFYMVMLTVADEDGGSTNVDIGITAQPKDVDIVFSGNNPVAVQVAAPGGASGAITLAFTVKEADLHAGDLSSAFEPQRAVWIAMVNR